VFDVLHIFLTHVKDYATRSGDSGQQDDRSVNECPSLHTRYALQPSNRTNNCR